MQWYCAYGSFTYFTDISEHESAYILHYVTKEP